METNFENQTRAPRPSDFFTLLEVADLLGIGRSAAYQLAQRDQLPIPVVRVGRQYRVSREAYQALKGAQHVQQKEELA